MAKNIGAIKNKKSFFLSITFLLFVIALFFRIYKISSYPVSLSMDEASIGYNAYSILKTGRDEWGARFPLAFRSVGDYKPPVDIYMSVPSIFLFGLNEFAVRLPVVLAGSLTIVVFILLLKELGFGNIASLFGGLWLAVLPWHIHFSRGSFEAVSSLFFLILGTLLFLVSVRKKSLGIFVLTIIGFSLSVWAYHSERLFSPILFAFLLFVNRNKLRFLFENRLKLLVIIATTFVFTAPFLYLTFFTPAIRERAISTSVFREQNLIMGLNNGNYSGPADFVLNNDVYLVFRHILGKYLNYFDLRFWFWKGMGFAPPGYPDVGLIYLVDIPFLLAGLYSVIFSKNKLLRNLSLFWFFLGPLPASFTMNEQHTLRSLVWIPAFGFMIVSGFDFLLTRINKHKIKLFALFYLFLLSLSIAYFSDMYFRQYSRFFSEFWQYGYKQIALYACENKNKYDKIFISETFGSEGPLSTGIPYIYVLFYCKYDPGEHLANGKTDNIFFKRTMWDSDKNVRNSLLIGSPWDLPLDKIPKGQVIKTIYFLNGVPGFVFVETR